MTLPFCVQTLSSFQSSTLPSTVCVCVCVCESILFLLIGYKMNRKCVFCYTRRKHYYCYVICEMRISLMKSDNYWSDWKCIYIYCKQTKIICHYQSIHSYTYIDLPWLFAINMKNAHTHHIMRIKGKTKHARILFVCTEFVLVYYKQKKMLSYRDNELKWQINNDVIRRFRCR